MRFNILINQLKAIEWGLNLQQSVLMAYCYELSSWAEPTGLDGEVWYYSARQKIISELPILTSKIDTVYRQLKELEIKGLIVCKFFANKQFIRLTEKGKSWNSEKNPSPENIPIQPGKKSDSGPEIFPTNYNTNNNSTIDEGGKPPKQIFDDKIKESKRQFLNSVASFVKEHNGRYPKTMYFNFCSYWLEKSQGGKTLRFQKQKFFDLGRRLATWHTNTNPEQLKKAWEDENSTKDLIQLLKPLLN